MQPIKMLDEPIGVVIDPFERRGLKALCLEFDIPILYENAFKRKHCLWAFSPRGIAYCGTFLMMRLKTRLCGLNELKWYLESEQWKEAVALERYRKAIAEASELNPLAIGLNLATSSDEPLSERLKAYLLDCLNKGMSPGEVVDDWM